MLSHIRAEVGAISARCRRPPVDSGTQPRRPGRAGRHRVPLVRRRGAGRRPRVVPACRVLPALRPLRLGRPARADGQRTRRHRRGDPRRPRRGRVPLPRADLRTGRGALARAASRGCAGSTSTTANSSTPHPIPTAPSGRTDGCCRCSRWSGPMPTSSPRRMSARPAAPADGIRFLGSAVATQLSVTLSNLFGDKNLDAAEKKALMFTDSVQDAAHRAGFVQARSHSLTLRTALRARTRRQRTRPRRTQPGSDRPRRKRPDAALSAAAARHRRPRRVRRVLAARRPRQLAAGRREQGQAATAVRRPPGVRAAVPHRPHPGTHRQRRRRGVPGRPAHGADHRTPAVERAERDATARWPGCPTRHWPAGCAARWNGSAPRAASTTNGCGRYVEKNANRYHIWGGRPRGQGMPAFPKGRPAPAFPALKSGTGALPEGFDPITAPSSWYARWTSRCLDVSPQDGTFLAKALFAELAEQMLLSHPHHRDRHHGLRIGADRRASQRAHHRGAARSSATCWRATSARRPCRAAPPPSTNSTVRHACSRAAPAGLHRTPEGRQLLPSALRLD